MSKWACDATCDLCDASRVTWAERINDSGEVVRVDLLAGECCVGHLQLATSGTWSAYLTNPDGDEIALMRGETREACGEALLREVPEEVRTEVRDGRAETTRTPLGDA